MPEESEKILYYSNLILLLLVSAGMGIFLIGMPKYADDLWYLVRMRPWFESQGVWYPTDGGNFFTAGIPWREIVDTIREHLAYDNARVCNMVVIIFLLMPKWIGSGIALLAWIGAMYFSFGLAGVNWSRSRLVIPALAMWSLMMPWSQQMGALDYQFNYLVSSGLMLWFLRSMQTGAMRRWPGSVLFAVVFFIAIWHEGFALPVLTGLIAVGVLDQKLFRSKEMIIIVSGLFLGLIWFLIAPSTGIRFVREVSWHNFDIADIGKAFLSHPAYLIFMALIIGLIIRHRAFNKIVGRNILFWGIGGLTVIILQMFVTHTRRTGWWADIAGIIGVIYLLRVYWGRILKKYVLIRRGLLISLVSVCIAYWSVVDILTIRISTQSREWTRQFLFERKNTIFSDVLTLADMPVFCLYTPDAGLYHSVFWLARHYHYYGKIGVMTIIPERLRYIDDRCGRKIEGDGNVRDIDGILVAKGEYEFCDEIHASVRYSNGVVRSREYRVYTFESEADGRQYHYLYPEPDLIGDHSGEIEEIKIMKVLPSPN